jgi:hypothetical protein
MRADDELVRQLLAELRQREWEQRVVDTDDPSVIVMCVSCGQRYTSGHAVNCSFIAAVAEAKRYLSKTRWED